MLLRRQRLRYHPSALLPMAYPLYDRDFFDGSYIPQLPPTTHYDFYAPVPPQPPQLTLQPQTVELHSDMGLATGAWRSDWARANWQPATAETHTTAYQPYAEVKPRPYQVEPTPSTSKPFRCQICGKSFSQAANLTAHRRVHTGEKPFECSVCSRPFSQSSSLVTHRRTHTGERPYPCKHCEKAFTDSSTLTKHLRTHTGQKPYGCPLCQMRFTQSGNLHRHMKTHKT